MTLYFQNLIPNISSLFIVSFLVSCITYALIYISNRNFLNFLHVPAAKSSTNAKLLGGIGTTIGLLSTLMYANYAHYNERVVEFKDLKHMLFIIFPLFVLTLYGYLDDKYEVRARYKLLFQITAISSYAFFTATQTAPNHYILGFLLSMFVGLALINGANLLDGLDTMSIKIGIAASLGFLYIGIKAESIPNILLSTSTIACLSSFYFFNKEPAKLYMGEIGGGVLGFIFYVQSVFGYQNFTKFAHGFYSLSWCLIIGALPICELAISFFRRLWMGKSPFRGDRLHLHHILRSKLKITASQTSTIIGGIYLVTIAVGQIVSKRSNSFYGLISAYAFLSLIYVRVCFSEWKASKENAINKNLFLLFENKTVHIINSQSLIDIDIKTEQKSA